MDNNYNSLIERIHKLKNIVINTNISLNEYKKLNILIFNDTVTNTLVLKNIFLELDSIYLDITEQITLNNIDTSSNFINNIIYKLENIHIKLSNLFRLIGTKNIDDFFYICFDSNFINSLLIQKSDLMNSKYSIISKYLHPIDSKIIKWKNKPNIKNIKKNRIVEDFSIVENSDSFDCFDLARTSKRYYKKVCGIKISIQNVNDSSTTIVSCIIDDLLIDCMLDNDYIKDRLLTLINNKPNESDFMDDKFKKFIDILSVKDLLIYNNEEIYDRYIGYLNNIILIKAKTLSEVSKEFLCNEMYLQRLTLIQLLFNNTDSESHYLANMLYDLLKDQHNEHQNILYNSLPSNVKCLLKESMKKTINITKGFNKENISIPLEQQICLMKVNDYVKEKAFIKLREINSKSDDSGIKAKQYLEGLLKIPFNNIKEEPILKVIKNNKMFFSNVITYINDIDYLHNDINKVLFGDDFLIENYKNKFNNISNIEILKYMNILKSNILEYIKYYFNNSFKKNYINVIRTKLIIKTILVNNFIKKHNIKYKRLLHSGKNKLYLKNNIINFFNYLCNKNDINLIIDFYKINIVKNNISNIINYIDEYYYKILNNNKLITNFVSDSNSLLDNSVYGHTDVKNQLQKIFCQWINGENTGYCFGFEGPPGVGKTSLAKNGISNCLVDENGNNRPFHFIGIGGSSNGSTLEGHSYTYVGSTWGKIIDILMNSKCMNPIIFIDELDKVSNTERGREIIGILTHLTDSTQNDSFQDKYFNGIDIDLSKILFIFSYNNPNNIDKILLDRIHRLKFNSLTIEEKIEISIKFLLPDIYKNMGLNNIININNEVIEYIIINYTCEPGVRKLKEILFDIIGSININIFKNNDINIPINLTIHDIDNIYLINKTKISTIKIHKNNSVGVINGLWANNYGMGGVLAIEALYYPTNNFLEYKLTGMQGDVMKESMNVAKTLSWSLFCEKYPNKVEDIIHKFTTTKLQGIHIHVPEGSTPKEGPSAGAAITTSLYSLFTNKKIYNKLAITGEICLQGNITKIGGLNHKIFGGINAGVETFIYPKDNHDDFVLFKNKYSNKKIFDKIKFIEVEHIKDVFNIAFL